VAGDQVGMRAEVGKAVNEPTARSATREDLPVLRLLYRHLETEMSTLRPGWRHTNGLPLPHGAAIESKLEDSTVAVGTFDGAVVGFLIADFSDDTCVIEHMFTETEARGIGIGEAMMDFLYDEAAKRRITEFDVTVLPGHREAKNFFEGQGFRARLIVMHHGDC
jgi:ribosomal protein S18 acetylase RimI-like enzyme